MPARCADMLSTRFRVTAFNAARRDCIDDAAARLVEMSPPNDAGRIRQPHARRAAMMALSRDIAMQAIIDLYDIS